ncbi:MAG: Asp23/Gls24 family envelope stress response protein [Tissierellia bacterium]|nr:Asp23/Gls24 family envelope stress response protein [Tissierellia bacterium]
MSAKLSTEYGDIIIENSVIAALAGISAMQSYGIVGMASKNAKDGLFELLKSDYMAKGIRVEVYENSVSIDLHVILEYGVRISVVAQNIIDNIKFNVENYTGLEVGNVNVFVQGVRIDKR